MAISSSPSLLFPLLSLFLFFPNLSSSQQETLPFPSFPIPNPRLLSAYIALQAWKLAITSDPNGFTADWIGHNVCNYSGVYCAPALDDPQLLTVAGIDLNHANIAGFLPEELGLLKDLALLHLNSNRFTGKLPASFVKLHLLYELDISNNLFDGPFPCVVLYMPSLKFLDIRFNQFCGEVPARVFDLELDALFLNDNKFTSPLPENLGNSPVSVLVVANNNAGGCIPASVARMGETLEEIIISNMGISGCLRPEIGNLKQLTVLDVSFNRLAGELPESIGQLRRLEQLNVAHNKLSGEIPASVCALPNLQNFTYAYNFFSGEPASCRRLPATDDRGNCIPDRPLQRSPAECRAVSEHPVDCAAAGVCSRRENR